MGRGQREPPPRGVGSGRGALRGAAGGPLLSAGRAPVPGAFPSLRREVEGKGRRARSERGGDGFGCPGVGSAVGSRC